MRRLLLLKACNETRGVGGLFFDDLNEQGFEQSFAFMQALVLASSMYVPIVERRKQTDFGERERDFNFTAGAATLV